MRTKPAVTFAATVAAAVSFVVVQAPPAHATPTCPPGQLYQYPINGKPPGCYALPTGEDESAPCDWANAAPYTKTDWWECKSGIGPQNVQQYNDKQAEDRCWANPPGGDPATNCAKRGSWRQGFQPAPGGSNYQPPPGFH